VRGAEFPAQTFSPYRMLKGEAELFDAAMRARGDPASPRLRVDGRRRIVIVQSWQLTDDSESAELTLNGSSR
jgi:hypothetical protein